MKTKWMSGVAMAALLLAMSAQAFAQAGTTKIRGELKDDAGQPIVGAVVQMSHKETGRKITLKTDKKGEFYSLGVTSGTYDVLVTKDGKTIWTIGNFPVRLTPEDLVVLKIDLAKEKKAAVAEGQSKMSEEQKKHIEQVQKENAKIGNLNKMLAEGQAALDAGNFDQAIATFQAAATADPSRDLLWARLGDAHNTAAKKTTDAAARKQHYAEGAVAYRKALEIATAAPAEGAAAKTLKTPAALGAYYNNLGESLGKSGDSAGALQAYDKAVETDPVNAAMYHFNKGATLTNMNKVDDAIVAYDKAIAADPSRADSYYYKGINLLNKATMKGNEMVTVPGTAEAFNKYLELEPDGPLAAQAKEMLAAMGAKIETSYGKSRKTKK
ncbi:MAG TPA: tetratricopeptide repeat protein [Terriglobales bacterium]|nr:tetratricopeptide repeat protein [Terriglobales bacterium]